MVQETLIIQKSKPLHGIISLLGAKNAVLPIMSSLLLTQGVSTLTNVPNSSDVSHMIALLTDLGAQITHNHETHTVTVDTTTINQFQVCPEIMSKMRASILVMGPLLARFGKATVAFPGGCVIGARPIDFHLRGFAKLGAKIKQDGEFCNATIHRESLASQNRRIVFEYPSVGATENVMMCAALTPGTTTIVNAAIEPEVLDLVAALQKMGAKIICGPGLLLSITGVQSLQPIEHAIIPDRLEAGSLLLAAAATGGSIHITNGQPHTMDIFLEKLQEMGHSITIDDGIVLQATSNPHAISIKTAPYPGFPTDLQAPMIAALTRANGVSFVEETVFENRLSHVQELQKMGAQITINGNKATIRGVDELYGCDVIASDIRASCALAIAGLTAIGTTTMTGIHHWKRGYDHLEKKLGHLGGNISLAS